MRKNERVICNCCGNELKRCGSRYEDHLYIVKQWGYLSEHDGLIEEMDICPECLERWERSFVFASDKRPATELL